MDIDLELPSCEQERSKINSRTVFSSVVDGLDGLDTDEEDTSSSDTNENFEGVVRAKADADETSANFKSGSLFEPQNGQIFESKEEAYSFYREYARSMGFGITIKASRRSKISGNFIDIKIACSRFGKKRMSKTTVNPRPCIKTDCKAGMHMKKKQDGKWFTYSFVKEHNHEICQDDFYYAIRGRNKKSSLAMPQKKGLQLALDDGEVKEMLDYFMSMQEKYLNFFYAIDLDDEKHLRSVLWVDSKARHDYGYFGDVVVFDTYYIRSKYKIPFVPIVGVNHHFQHILLGGALIGEETTSVLAWLMQTWLKAIGGKAPMVVITDQDNSLKEAVADVFPNSRHCFCLWHILEMIGEKVVSNQNEKFMAKLSKCIYRSWTDEEFEKRWWKIVDKFDLRNDEWIQLVYEDRRKWVPNYMGRSFLAGMSTTERSGSIISFFDKYISCDCTFREFFEKYKEFTEERCNLESNADFDTQNQKTALKSHLGFEKQAYTVYTSTMFGKIQQEILGMSSCQFRKENEDEATLIYRVDDFEEHRDFLVAWNEAELDVSCSCRSFEYRGFLCRHAILVLQMSGLNTIPPKYILKRWSRNAKVRQTAEKSSKKVPQRVERFDDLCKLAVKLSEAGSLSQEAYNIAFRTLEEVLRKCVSVKGSFDGSLNPNTPTIHGSIGDDEDRYVKSTVKLSKRRKTNKKSKGPFESEGLSSGQDSLVEMERLNQSNDIENCYVPRSNIQGMELGSRTFTLDGFYGARQSRAEELRSLSASRESYYIPQGMEGLGQLSFKGLNMQECFEAQENALQMDGSGSSSRTQFHEILGKVHKKQSQ